MAEHILYCNRQVDIVVLDLPASIAHAQESTQRLVSTPAVENPYNTPEPKRSKRDALLAKLPADESQYHVEIQHVLRRVLKLLHEHWHDAIWYRPRIGNESGRGQPDLASSDCPRHDDKHENHSQIPPLVLSSSPNRFCCPKALTNIVCHNPYQAATDVLVTELGRFVIPPNATFLGATVHNGLPLFEEAVRSLVLPSFDLAVLDPPWTNRSVRNSRTYYTTENQPSDPFEELLPTVSAYLNERAYIAVWITNKRAIRLNVLRMCISQGFVLMEEWIWLKVTAKGDAMTPIDGVWRHPYEIMLLFRRDAGSAPQSASRRVIVAVPDIHSRKPSLKSLFDQLLPPNYRALEVFARSLTAGWWSWGDEVLKFQYESNWR